eukprot:353535-Chlamydomonas_euryale.AAC.4
MRHLGHFPLRLSMQSQDCKNANLREALDARHPPPRGRVLATALMVRHGARADDTEHALSHTKQVIKDDLQGQRVKNGEQAGGGHQPNPTRPHRTTIRPVTLGPSHRRSAATIFLWTCKQLWKAEHHQLTRLTGGCGRRRLHPRTKRQPRARGALAGRHSSFLRASIGSHQAIKWTAIPAGITKQAERP